MTLDTGVTPRLLMDWSKDLPVPAYFLRFIDPTTADAGELAGMWQHVVDGLTEQIAILDEDWTILIVNQSWAGIAKLYGDRLFVPSANYLECCRELAAEGLEVARDVVEGIEQITAGKRNSFQLVYRARQPELGRDHQLCVNRFEVAGRQYASVTRYDITRLIELRRLREDFGHSVIAGQAVERRRIGREIHDSTSQLIVCLGMKVGQLKRSHHPEEAGDILEEMEQLLAQAHQAIRSISYLAHPPALSETSLSAALQALVEGFGRRTNLDIRIQTIGTPQWCCDGAEEAAYRIVQEALSNVYRHAHANQATVRITAGKEMTHVMIADDGVGIRDRSHFGVGLAGMRSRMSELGGRLSIRAGNPGTAVIASFPKRRIMTGGLAFELSR